MNDPQRRVAYGEPDPELDAFNEFMDTNFILFKSKGGRRGWWLPAHNLGINEPLTRGLNLWVFSILPTFPEKKAYIPEGTDPQSEPAGIVIRPMWHPYPGNKGDDVDRTEANARTLLKMAQQAEPVGQSVQKQLKWIESKFGIKIPNSIKAKISREAPKMAARRWSVNRVKTNDTFVPLDGRKPVPTSWGRPAMKAAGRVADLYLKYLREHGNPEAADEWEKMNEEYGDKLKKTAFVDEDWWRKNGRRYKGAITRATRMVKTNPKKALAVADEWFKLFDKYGTPDDWHRVQRLKEDAEMEIRMQRPVWGAGKVKKQVTDWMWVISKDPAGGFLITIGDPKKSGSKIKARFSDRDTAKNELKWWVRNNLTKTVSPNHLIDLTGLKIVPGTWDQKFIDSLPAKEKKKMLKLAAYPGVKGKWINGRELHAKYQRGGLPPLFESDIKQGVPVVLVYEDDLLWLKEQMDLKSVRWQGTGKYYLSGLRMMKKAARTLREIAKEIRQDWARVSPYAKPYLDAMGQLGSINDDYYADSAKSVVLYFLSNARSWKGEVAKRIKKELNDMAKRAIRGSIPGHLAFTCGTIYWSKTATGRSEAWAFDNFGERVAVNIPKEVDDLAETIKKENKGYDDSKAFATAWSIYCRYVNPGSGHCHKDSPSDYFPSRKAEDITEDDEKWAVYHIEQQKKRLASQVAKTIADQMGGAGKLKMMLGATVTALPGDKGLAIKWPNPKRTKGNYVEIILDRGKDLYNMTFYNLSKAAKKKVKEYKGLFFDMLVDTFERQTGWYLRLGSMEGQMTVKNAAMQELEAMSRHAADYPWKECIKEQMDRYHDKDTAEKVCGKIYWTHGPGAKSAMEELKALASWSPGQIRDENWETGFMEPDDPREDEEGEIGSLIPGMEDRLSGVVPGVPDGTGPHGDTPECQLYDDVEELDDTLLAAASREHAEHLAAVTKEAISKETEQFVGWCANQKPMTKMEVIRELKKAGVKEILPPREKRKGPRFQTGDTVLISVSKHKDESTIEPYKENDGKVGTVVGTDTAGASVQFKSGQPVMFPDAQKTRGVGIYRYTPPFTMEGSKKLELVYISEKPAKPDRLIIVEQYLGRGKNRKLKAPYFTGHAFTARYNKAGGVYFSLFPQQRLHVDPQGGKTEAGFAATSINPEKGKLLYMGVFNKRPSNWKKELEILQSANVPAMTASEGDEQLGRFEEGKPADPTENMSPEDAKKWKEENEKHKDEFKASALETAWGDTMTREGAIDPKMKRAADEYLKFCQKVVNDHFAKQHPTLTPGVLSYMPGRRYWRIVNHYDGGTGQQSAFGFIDVTNGEILKAEAWRKPAKHARGSLLDKATWKKSITPQGVAYLRAASDESTQTGKAAAMAPGGLYGFTKKVQADCESCGRKLARHALGLAKKAYQRDERVADFLTIHAKRGKSTTAKVLVAALQAVGPRVATEKEQAKRLAQLREARGVSAAPKPGSKEEQDAMYAKGYRYMIQWGPGSKLKNKDPLYAKTMADLTKLIRTDFPKEKGWKGVEMDKPGKKATEKEAANRKYGLYGFPAKVATLGLSACTNLKEFAGYTASDLHMRRSAHHARYTGFLKQHAKEAKCLYSKLLHGCYPDEGTKLAREIPASVDEWIAWED